jgi:predicted transcriptional regulator
MADELRAPPLGSLEAKIMRAAWDHPDEYLPVREMLELLDDELAYTTVMTVMNRLFEKGLLHRRRQGRAWCYRPTSSREAHVATAMTQVLDTAEDRTAALLHFLADLDPGEAAALRRLLDAAERP